jgi:hypothetical protein
MAVASEGESRTDEPPALDFSAYLWVPSPSHESRVHDQTADVPRLFRLWTGIRVTVRDKPIYSGPQTSILIPPYVSYPAQLWGSPFVILYSRDCAERVQTL